MPKEILSKSTGELLHQIYFSTDHIAQSEERINFGKETDFLQVSSLRIRDTKNFKAHTHLERNRNLSNLKAQESWVVLSGKVKVHYYDEYDQHVCDVILGSGDITVTYAGGHGYTTLEPETLVFEFKSGPYEGQIIDKRFI